MAGDWMKIEKCTPDKPEVFFIADELGIDPDAVFGKCFRVWSWFDDHTTNGKANGCSVSRTLVDRLVSVQGFANAMVSVGWLVEYGAGVAANNFERHNGETAKQRALTAKRVAKHTAKKTNDSLTHDALPREEKRRDISITDVIDKKRSKFDPISHLVSLGVDQQVATDYCQQRKKKPTLTALQGIEHQAAKAGMTLEKALRICCSRGWEGFKADWVIEKPVPTKQSNKTATAFASYTTIFPQEEMNDGRVIDVTPRLG